MGTLLRCAILAPLTLGAFAADAQGYRPTSPVPAQNGGLPGPGTYPPGYDTGGDQDKRPELAPYQQGGGQQTGGPARNLIPGDTLHVAPR